MLPPIDPRFTYEIKNQRGFSIADMILASQVADAIDLLTSLYPEDTFTFNKEASTYC